MSLNTLHRRTPRLSLCTCSTDDVVFKEIPDFDQEDLSELDIFILDVFDQLYLWCGRAVEEEPRKQLLPRCLQEYMSRDPAGRKESEVQVWIVSHGSEPGAFRRHFDGWFKQGYGGEEMYSSERKKIRQENARIDVETQLVDQTFTRVTRHPYRTLLRPELPLDVLRDHREHHLSNKQFWEAVKMTRFDFYRLPEWKQAQLLRSARLAHFPPAHPHTLSSSHRRKMDKSSD